MLDFVELDGVRFALGILVEAGKCGDEVGLHCSLLGKLGKLGQYAIE